MGYSGFSSTSYTKAVDSLKQTGQQFQRSQTAQVTGNYGNVAANLDPRKLKNGLRECCFTAGFQDALPIVVSIDGTGSMDQVPYIVQAELPKLIDLLLEQGVSDRPNVLFMLHDDEIAMPPDAVFQISQFETGSAELLGALNELIVPHNGGGNRGEAYHLSFYATRHLRLEAYERDQSKGFFFMICDEEPFYWDADPLTNGTSPAVAKAAFGDSIEAVIPMVESLRQTAERFHVFVLRPGHTSHGTDKNITKKWRNLFTAAGINPEYVIEVPETEALVSTMALTIGGTLGADRDEMIDVLQAKGAAGVGAAVNATALVPAGSAKNAMVPVGQASGALATTGGSASGRPRR